MAAARRAPAAAPQLEDGNRSVCTGRGSVQAPKPRSAHPLEPTNTPQARRERDPRTGKGPTHVRHGYPNPRTTIRHHVASRRALPDRAGPRPTRCFEGSAGRSAWPGAVFQLHWSGPTVARLRRADVRSESQGRQARIRPRLAPSTAVPAGPGEPVLLDGPSWAPLDEAVTLGASTARTCKGNAWGRRPSGFSRRQSTRCSTGGATKSCSPIRFWPHLPREWLRGFARCADARPVEISRSRIAFRPRFTALGVERRPIGGDGSSRTSLARTAGDSTVKHRPETTDGRACYRPRPRSTRFFAESFGPAGPRSLGQSATPVRRACIPPVREPVWVSAPRARISRASRFAHTFQGKAFAGRPATAHGFLNGPTKRMGGYVRGSAQRSVATPARRIQHRPPSADSSAKGREGFAHARLVYTRAARSARAASVIGISSARRGRGPRSSFLQTPPRRFPPGRRRMTTLGSVPRAPALEAGSLPRKGSECGTDYERFLARTIASRGSGLRGWTKAVERPGRRSLGAEVP